MKKENSKINTENRGLDKISVLFFLKNSIQCFDTGSIKEIALGCSEKELRITGDSARMLVTVEDSSVAKRLIATAHAALERQNKTGILAPPITSSATKIEVI